jgi:hypothetical protein
VTGVWLSVDEVDHLRFVLMKTRGLRKAREEWSGRLYERVRRAECASCPPGALLQPPQDVWASWVAGEISDAEYDEQTGQRLLPLPTSIRAMMDGEAEGADA